jgi:NAD(P)-dependent dehydrogenase (short-subunit alcohol dehydrogenase family)
MGRLEGKVAIVTGATGGCGAATSEHFIREGAKVALAARSMDKAAALAERLGPNALPVHFDLQDDKSIETTVAATVERFGGLDILVNNAVNTEARIYAKDLTAVDGALDIWDETMALNVRAIVVACKFAIPHMLKAGGGSIINVASGAGLLGDTVRLAYGTSKGAVMVLTKYLATQHGRQGIRANCISPGIILLEKTKGQAMLDVAARHVLTPRLGEPNDIAALATYLAGDESSYVTGQTISCDGGLMAHVPMYADQMAGMESAMKGLG